MGKKIDKIFNSKSPTKLKQNLVYARSLEKAKAKSEKEKWKIFKIAQDNQLMLKRLHEAQTSYNHVKYQKDYKKSQYYKKNICEFPEGDNIQKSSVENFYSNYTTYNNGFFNKNKQEEYSKTTNQFYPSQSANQHNDHNKTHSNFGNFASTTSNAFKKNKLDKIDHSVYNKTNNNFSNSTKINKKPDKRGVVSLYYKSFFFQDLLQCQVTFFLQSKKFIIKIKTSDTETEDCYYLIFEGAEEIMKMKSIYKSYDDIVNDLDHNVHSDLVLIKNVNFSSSYVSSIIIILLFLIKIVK